MNTFKENERIVEIKPDVLRYVIGREHSNLYFLQNKYPSLRINTTRRPKSGIMIEGESINQIDNCIRDINNYVMSAYAYRENNLKKKKINKEKIAKKKSIQAINKIKETIKRDTDEKEAMEREIENAKKEGRTVVDLKKKKEAQKFNERLNTNFYSALSMDE